LTRRTLLAAAAALPAAAAAPRSPLARLVDPSDSDTVLGLGVIARDRRGRVSLAEAHGRSVLGEGHARNERPFTLDAPIRVASVSKMVATAGLMRLVEARRLDLDADVSDLLGFSVRHPAHPVVRITPTMLLSHTSGLRNGRTYPVPVGKPLRDVLTPGSPGHDDGSWFAPADQPPGAFFAYADINFAVLAQIAERITGLRFDRWMTGAVLAPLGLDAGYNWSGVSQAARDRAAAPCRPVQGVWTPQTDAVVPFAPAVRVYADEGVTAADYRVGENGFAFAPQGGLRASVRDLDVVARAFASGRIGDPRMGQPAWHHDGRNGDTAKGYYRAYGLGVQVPTGVPGPGGDAFFGPESTDWRGHFGEAYGLVSGCWWNVRDGRTLAYIINGTPRPAEESPGRRSAATPWEETLIDAALRA
jgi:CubicO group peptidase (beta-lactamase class C family)